MNHSSHNIAMRMHSHAIHMHKVASSQARRMALMAQASARRGHAMMRKMAAAQRRQANAQARRVAEQKREVFCAAVRAATEHPLDCLGQRHPAGAYSMLFGRNWVHKGIDYVVMRCNTTLPYSGERAALMRWTDGNAEWVALEHTTFAQLSAQGERLFLFRANLHLPNGESFAVLRARHEADDGVVGHWCFPTVGFYQRQPFCVDLNGVGTFLEPSLQKYMVARPMVFDERHRTWVWHGRSSIQDQGKIVVTASFRIGRVSSARQFFVPSRPGAPNIAALRCVMRDSRGDPLAVLNTMAGREHKIIAKGDTVYLLIRPNKVRTNPLPLFVAPARRMADGTYAFAGSGPFLDSEVAFELEANDHDSAGRPFVSVSANALVDRQRMVAVALRSLSLNERHQVRAK